MLNSNLTYNIDTSINTAGFTFTSVITGTQVFPVAIVDQFPTGNFKHKEGTVAKCSFYCAWGDRNNLGSFLLYCYSQTIGGYDIQIGASHPIYPGLYCDDIVISPLGDNVPVTVSGYQTTYNYARIDCSYSPQVFEPGSPLVLREETIEVTGEVISIPAQTITVSGTPTSDPKTIYYPLLRYGVKIMNVTTLPLGNVLSCMNTVNSTNLTIQLGGGISTTVSAEFALYEGIGQTKRTITTSGVAKWDITHTWLISPINFNYVLNPALITGSAPITVAYGTSPTVFVRPDQVIYPSSDHAGLLGV